MLGFSNINFSFEETLRERSITFLNNTKTNRFGPITVKDHLDDSVSTKYVR